MSNSDIATWKELLDEALAQNGETWADVEFNTMTEEDMNKLFDSGHRQGAQGCPFTIWTNKSVYFPVEYDGSESVGRVSRHPDGKPTEHISG